MNKRFKKPKTIIKLLSVMMFSLILTMAITGCDCITPKPPPPPVDPDTVEAAVDGFVSGNGLPIAGAKVKIGKKTLTTDAKGKFVFPKDKFKKVKNPGGDILPVEVIADGFAPGYAKILVDKEVKSYSVEVKLLQVTKKITDGNALRKGIDITRGIFQPEKIGSITISEYPDGVTRITGSITYLDPSTEDIDSTPGGDLLAQRTDNSNVSLESLGMMKFDLKDQNGNPITDLKGKTAQIKMKVPKLPDGTEMDVKAGDEVPLWYYDTKEAIWKEEGKGVVSVDSTGKWITGTVTHFTYWNYDWPVSRTTSVIFFIKDQFNQPIIHLRWWAEGKNYNGRSYKRKCSNYSSFTLPRSTAARTYSYRISTIVCGYKQYLKYSGGGYFSLTTRASEAAEFQTPTKEANCILNQNTENAEYINWQSKYGAAKSTLFVKGINYSPFVNQFIYNNHTGEDIFDPAAYTNLELSYMVEDKNNEDVSVSYTFTSANGISNKIPVGSGLSNVTGNISVGISNLPPGSPFSITLHAKDSFGNVSVATKYGQIMPDFKKKTVSGILKDTSGNPVAGNEVKLTERKNPETGFNSATTTDSQGYFQFDDVSTYYAYYAYGVELSTNLSVDIDGDSGIIKPFIWIYRRTISLFGGDASGNIKNDISYPTQWSRVEGDIKGYISGENLDISFWWDRFYVKVPYAASYGPYWLPVGKIEYNDNRSHYDRYYDGFFEVPISTTTLKKDLERRVPQPH